MTIESDPDGYAHEVPTRTPKLLPESRAVPDSVVLRPQLAQLGTIQGARSGRIESVTTRATVELLPGVFVTADGSARGPGLEAALALASAVTTLQAWSREASADSFERAATIEGAEVTLSWWNPEHSPAGANASNHRTYGSPAEAADAIRNGRV